MKARELISNAIKMCGHRYYSVSREDVHYAARGADGEITTQYVLCIQPGVDGTDCQHIYGSSVEELAEKLGEHTADRLMAGTAGDDEHTEH